MRIRIDLTGEDWLENAEDPAAIKFFAQVVNGTSDVGDIFEFGPTMGEALEKLATRLKERKI